MSMGFKEIAKADEFVLSTALEVAASDTAIGSYRFEGSKFELDPNSTDGLDEVEKKMVEQFSINNGGQNVEVVVHQANEGLLDSLATNNLRAVASLISGSISAVERNVQALTNLVTRMHKTLLESQKRLKSVRDRDDVNVLVEFGAYSRFFNIGNKLAKTDKQFIDGLYVHRAASDWCSVISSQALSEVGAVVVDAFPGISKGLPILSEAIVHDVIDKVNRIFMDKYSKDAFVGLGGSSSYVSGVKIPKNYPTASDLETFVKGAMFDGNVLLYTKPKKPDLGTLAYICTIVRDPTRASSEVKSFEIEYGKELKQIIDHGVEITSNTLANLKALDGYIDDYLKPMRKAVVYVSQNDSMFSGDDAKLLGQYTAMARLLNDCVMHPLLTCTWVDARLCRLIAGIAEAYFVRDPNARTLFAKDIRAV